MSKQFISNKPAINMTVVGFGQAGSRVADVFASYTYGLEGVKRYKSYNCLALNSNDGDLKGLKNIPLENRVSLGLEGMGKNPEKAIRILEDNEAVKNQLKQFIHDKVRPQDELVLFVAGLGGGTGTSTIVKAISEFNDFHNIPLIRKELLKLIDKFGKEEVTSNLEKYKKIAFKEAEQRFVKIGVIAMLPSRSDGADVLRQVNKFAQDIWKLANDKSKGIAFVMFPDNQFLYDEFKKLSLTQQKAMDNYRDYANYLIAEHIHEINTMITNGGSSIEMDTRDLKRALLEHNGCLVISKKDATLDAVKDADSIAKQFMDTFKSTNLHSPINIKSEDEDGKVVLKRIYHAGVYAVIDPKKSYGNGAFIDDTLAKINEEYVISGTVFNGYAEIKNDFNVSTYVFYKIDGLPSRLEKGLYEEYLEYEKRHQKADYANVSIKGIDTNNLDDFDLNLDLDSLGLVDLLGPSPASKSTGLNENNSDEFAELDDLLKDMKF